MTQFEEHPDYESLPESIKDLYTPEEFAWLSDEQKIKIVQRETTPEPEDVLDYD